ncbi:MAG: hypothetical protein Q9218_008017 [Villophora microphyllina]
MYGNEDVYQLPDLDVVPTDQVSEDEDDLRDPRVSNPWTLARLNAPIRPRRPGEISISDLSSNEQLLTPAKRHGVLGGDLSSPLRLTPGPGLSAGLPSPEKSDDGTPSEEPSEDSFPYPLKPWSKAQRESHSRPRHSTSDDLPSCVLDTWVQRPSAQPRSTSEEGLFLPQHDTATSRPRGDFLRASELPQGTPLSHIPDISQKPARKAGPRKQRQEGNVNKPFKPPVVHNEERVWFDHLGPSSSTHSPTKKATPQSQKLPSITYPNADRENDPLIDSSSPPPPQHPGLALTMDYEARKAAATAQRRAFLRQQTKSQTPSLGPGEIQGTQIKISSSQQSNSIENALSQQTQIKISPSQQAQSSSSPHQNRYKSAIAALHAPSVMPFPASEDVRIEDGDAAEDVLPPLDPKDPRAYLLRTLSRPPTKNIRSGLLPLETISLSPNHCPTKDLLQTINTVDLQTVLPERLQRSERGAEGFENVKFVEKKAWEMRIRVLLEGLYCVGEGGGAADFNVVIDSHATLWERSERSANMRPEETR